MFTRLALEGVRRRPLRAGLLAATTALAVGTLFAALTLGRGVRLTMHVGLSRMGADLMVVPRDTLVHLTPALLTAEPTPHTLDASTVKEIHEIPGVDQAAPQRTVRITIAEQGHQRDVDLVLFDPEHDFTVQPWLQEKLARAPREGDVLVGGRRPETLGQEVTIAGRTLTVYGRLAQTGVGPFDRSYFVTFATASTMEGVGSPGISAVLIRLAPDARAEQVQFALGERPDWKVATGNKLFTSVRQMLAAVFWGATGFTLVCLLLGGLMVGSVYSAVIAERRRELGLLLALGMRGRQLAGLIMTEAALTTALGGLVGVLAGGALLLLARRSLIYHLEWIDVPFVWPEAGQIVVDGLGCVLLAAALGLLGAALPAWRSSKRDPYEMVRVEGP